MEGSAVRWAQRWRELTAIALLAIAVAMALPDYLAGNGPWKVPEPDLTPLIQLRQTGLAVPGWHTQNHQKITLGGHIWSLQAIAPASQQPTTPHSLSAAPYLLLLRPQTSQTDQPQVEWMDIDGVQLWSTDQQQQLQVVVKPSGAVSSRSEHSFRSTARFFRGRNSAQTYAVLQWYAWANGGSPTPAHWFVADQIAQWRDRRSMPWVAVCVLIPLDPLADGSSVQPVASQLTHAIHAELASMLARVDPLPLTSSP